MTQRRVQALGKVGQGWRVPGRMPALPGSGEAPPAESQRKHKIHAGPIPADTCTPTPTPGLLWTHLLPRLMRAPYPNPPARKPCSPTPPGPPKRLHQNPEALLSGPLGLWGHPAPGPWDNPEGSTPAARALLEAPVPPNPTDRPVALCTQHHGGVGLPLYQHLHPTLLAGLGPPSPTPSLPPTASLRVALGQALGNRDSGEPSQPLPRGTQSSPTTDPVAPQECALERRRGGWARVRAQADRKLRMFGRSSDPEGRTGDFQGENRGMNDVSGVGSGITGGRD